MTLTQIFPEHRGPFDETTAETRALLVELYAPLARATVRINMIASLNGSAVGDDGTSESLSNRTDRRILGVIRDSADVVLVGARTVRREGYLGPRASTLAIVTLSGDLTGHRLGDAPHPPLILCPASAVARVDTQLAGIAHEVAVVQSPTLDAVEIVRTLTSRGLTSIVCEGGPTLAGALLDAGLVDELCLTTAAKLRSPGSALFARLADTPTATLTQLLVDSESTLYARWLLNP
jgi:riboflavin biosynthesis pyrimidine reductase